jgi:hypothetical protein
MYFGCVPPVLDLILLVAAHPDKVRLIWEHDGDESAIRTSRAVQNLKGSIRELAYSYGDCLRSCQRIGGRPACSRSSLKWRLTTFWALSGVPLRMGKGFKNRRTSLRASLSPAAYNEF